TRQIVSGAAVPSAGSAFADFLIGIPDTSSIAFGNADKYLRESGFDAYFNDDFRVAPGFTVNAGLRWDYSAPITEKYGRLVNLDIPQGFTAIAPVLSSNSTGSLTGQSCPSSLVRPDRFQLQPRVSASWRPIANSP